MCVEKTEMNNGRVIKFKYKLRFIFSVYLLCRYQLYEAFLLVPTEAGRWVPGRQCSLKLLPTQLFNILKRFTSFLRNTSLIKLFNLGKEFPWFLRVTNFNIFLNHSGMTYQGFSEQTARLNVSNILGMMEV